MIKESNQLIRYKFIHTEKKADLIRKKEEIKCNNIMK